MPKISWERHRLAELTAGLGVHKEFTPSQDEFLGRPASDWQDGEDWGEEGDVQPLALVISRREPDEPPPAVLNTSSPAPASPPRTLAARKAYDETLDVSIQRKVQEDKAGDEEEVSQPPAPAPRYHPYIRPTESEQDAPINLEIPKKPWPKRATPPHQPNPPARMAPSPVAEYEEEQPIDFSKKKEKEPPSSPLLTVNKEYRFQRNLLVILLQSISRSPAKGRDLVRFLKSSCEKVKSRGCSNGGAPKQNGQQQGASGGSGGGGFTGVPTGGGSTGGSLHSSRSNSTDQEDSFISTDTDFDSMEFDFAESATRKWMCENPDLNPLKVLDHITFKNEVTENHHSEVPKPPDLGALDRDTATFLQLAVPVPDPSSTFLDIGTDFGPVSLYEDDPFNLEQLIPSTFNLPPQQQPQPQQQQPLYSVEQQQQQQQLHGALNMSHSHPHQLQSRLAYPPVQPQPHLAFQSFLPETSISLRDTPRDHQEECFTHIKEEALPQQHSEPKVDASFLFPSQQDFRPISPVVNNNKPAKTSPSSSSSSSSSGPQRKKSTSGLTTEEEDLLNVPTLQMRIQILQQRYGIPPDAPLELINGGHGIKNPMVADIPEKKEVEKLPPMRCETDPSRFACRICGKSFGLARLLNRHMKCHSDTKRYLCTFCGKGFNDTFDLKRHTRTHTGVRPYKCNLCEKSFTQRCSLESHCLKVHGVTHCYEYKQRRSKVYVCEDCGHTTKEPEVHYIHLKDQHPYSPALLKFYDKRHFKFNNSNFNAPTM